MPEEEEELEENDEEIQSQTGASLSGENDQQQQQEQTNAVQVVDQEEMLRREIEQLKQSSVSSREHKERNTRFSILDTGCKGLIFVRFHRREDSPSEVIKNIMRDFIRDPEINLSSRYVVLEWCSTLRYESAVCSKKTFCSFFSFLFRMIPADTSFFGSVENMESNAKGRVVRWN